MRERRCKKIKNGFYKLYIIHKNNLCISLLICVFSNFSAIIVLFCNCKSKHLSILFVVLLSYYG